MAICKNKSYNEYMDKFFIIGGNPLYGEVDMDSAKNSLLPIIACSVLIKEEVVLQKAVKYRDVLVMQDIIKSLGGKAYWEGDSLVINCKELSSCSIDRTLTAKARASFFTLGALLGRLGQAKIGFPGGCDIGLRPVDIHISAIKNLGCKIVEKNGYIYADASAFHGGEVVLPFPSVGATENVMMLSASMPFRTEIVGGAKEPEIVDLALFINSCGGFVRGAGTDKIVIEGRPLHGCTYVPFTDRIEAGTFMVGCALCSGKVQLNGAKSEFNRPLISKLRKIGCNLLCDNDKIIIESKGRLESVGEIETAVYPGFPTDLQSQMMTLASVTKGSSIIVENVFENRFKTSQELIKMGADIKVKNGVCLIEGKEKLFGADVVSPDLRGGASLVLAGLYAEGYTTLSGVELIDRGYYKFEEKIASLGGNIKRIKE